MPLQMCFCLLRRLVRRGTACPGDREVQDLLQEATERQDGVAFVGLLQREGQHAADVGLPEDGRDDRVDDVVDERLHHETEGGADDHGHGQVDDVAPQQELLEICQHWILRMTRRAPSMTTRSVPVPYKSREPQEGDRP